MSNGAHMSNSPPTTPIAPRGRRASITEMFARPGNAAPPPLNTNTSNTTAPLFTAAASNAQQQPHRRRMSITTLGLSGSPTNQSAPFGQAAVTTTPTAAAGTTVPPPNGRRRRGSVSSSILSSSPTRDQAVVEEEDEEETPMPTSPPPFARRVSFSFRDRAASLNGIYQTLPILDKHSIPSFKQLIIAPSTYCRGGSLGRSLFRQLSTSRLLIPQSQSGDFLKDLSKYPAYFNVLSKKKVYMLT